jgi:malonyl-CoA O-methyltransferase
MATSKAIDSLMMRGNFSSHAGSYDCYASVQKRVVDCLGRRMAGLVPGNGLVLDVGTGTGALAAELIRAEPQRQLVVMDIARGMTRQAVQKLPGVFACDADARRLPFASGTFAGVVSSSVYQWVDCLPAAFAEVARVLRPGGFFALALFGEQTLHELRAAHRRAVTRHGSNRPSHVLDFPSRNEVAEALGAARLSCCDLTSAMEVEYHPSVPDLLRQLKRIGAGNASADRPRGLASRRVMQSMTKHYEAIHRCAAGLPASYEVIIALAVKAPERSSSETGNNSGSMLSERLLAEEQKSQR